MTVPAASRAGVSGFRRPTAGRVFVALAAVLAAMIVGMAGLLAGPASASPLPGAQNAVGVIAHSGGQRVGVHEQILAGQGRIRGPDYDISVVGSCVGPETGSATTGPETTIHGATRIAGESATRGGVLNEAEIAVVRGGGTVYTRSDGAIASVLQQADGRFSVVPRRALLR